MSLDAKYFTNVVSKLMKRVNLSREEASNAMGLIATGKTEPAEVAAFLVLLASKGETSEEISGLVDAMIKQAVDFPKPEGKLLDIVGTGGDGHDTVNISTSAAILCAASGAKVCKHGNRSVSSQSGSADVLESLKVKMLQPTNIKACINDCNIAFMFAPFFHPGMKHVSPVRKSLKVKTVFNILGPLLNPARAQRLYLGVYSPDLLDVYGQTLLTLGVEHALVVHCCGLDELAPLGVAEAVEVTATSVTRITIDTLSFGIPKCSIEDLKGGDSRHNASIMESVFSGGEASTGPIADTIALNAGAGLYVYGLAPSIAEGFALAKKVLSSGAALSTLRGWAAACEKLEP